MIEWEKRRSTQQKEIIRCQASNVCNPVFNSQIEQDLNKFIWFKIKLKFKFWLQFTIGCFTWRSDENFEKTTLFLINLQFFLVLRFKWSNWSKPSLNRSMSDEKLVEYRSKMPNPRANSADQTELIKLRRKIEQMKSERIELPIPMCLSWM